MEDIKEEIKSKVDIVELISRYTSIKKAGSNYKGNCPFHNENTPSFMVSPSLQIFKCFGCGRAGDVFTFLMEMEGINFTESLNRLGEQVGVDTSKYLNKSKKNSNYDKAIEANNLALKYYNYTLNSLSVGKKAKKYLSNRGITDKNIEEFKIGYSPNSWDSLTKYMTKKGYKETFLESIGLAKRANNYYDAFRGRVIFPLINEKNETVGFAGRTIINEDPKYLNTKNTIVFNKSSFLFNLNNAKVEIKRKKQAIVVEGIMDAVSPYCKGIKNIVATQGTSLTQEQVKLLKRYCSEAVLFFDSDAAGLEAAIRGIEIAQNNGLDIKIAELEEPFKDPDEAAQKSIDILIKAIDNAVPAFDFYFYYIEKKFDYSNALEKTKIVDFLRPKINNLKDQILKAHYTKKLSELIDVPESSLNISQDNSINKATIDKAKKEEVDLLFTYLFRAKSSILDKFYNQVVELNLLTKDQILILEDYSKKSKNINFNLNDYINNSKNKELLEELQLKDIGDFDTNTEIQEKLVYSLINQRKQAKIRQELKKLSNDIKAAERLHDAKKLDKLHNQFKILTKQLEKPH